MRLRLLVVLLCLCLPLTVLAQVSPPLPSGGGSGVLTLPETICANQVATALASSGLLTCSIVTPVMTTGLVPSGADLAATGQVLATHLAQPLPLAQGGLGISTGTTGGLPYFSSSMTLASSNTLPLNAPLFGGGAGQPPVAGTLSGTTLQLATVLGPHTTQVALEFDGSGNIIAGSGTTGGGGGIGGSWICAPLGTNGFPQCVPSPGHPGAAGGDGYALITW